MSAKPHILPEPRGLSRVGAAYYMGVSPSLFDEMVADGRASKPKMINGRTVWDRFDLDRDFEQLPYQSQKKRRWGQRDETQAA